MNIASLEVTHLDDHHLMVKVHWVSVYTKRDGSDERIDFGKIYLVQMIGKTPPDIRVYHRRRAETAA